VSSPNEPGYPRAGDGGANGSGSGSGPEGGALGGAASQGSLPGGPPERMADAAEVPPWQRGAARAAQPANRPAEAPARRETPARSEPPRGGNGGATGHSPGVDARLNRFLSGGAASAPQQEQDAAGWADPPEPSRHEPTARPEPPARPEPTVRPDQYASELPDLSGPSPRPAARKAAPERPAQEPASRPAAQSSRAQAASRHQGPVRASMQIRRVDPWSVLKVSSVLSVALFFVWMIAVAFLYLVLGGMGVWSKLNSNVGDLLTSASGSSGGELVSSGTIFGGAALIGLVNIVLLTAMATVGAFIYNLTTDIVGGVEVTLADRD
jgi:hypothetical protein